MLIASPGMQTRKRILIVSAVVAMLAVVATYLALSRGIDPAPRQVAVIDPESEPDAPSGEQAAGGQAATGEAITGESDPQRFAHSVALALFEWDTSASIPLPQYTGRLLAVADPTGEESPGLVADIASYLPTEQTWALLRPYATRQWITVSSIAVPGQWDETTATTPPGALLPGTTAYTVTGVRHRSGVWEGETVSSAHDVAFTIFIVCAPSYPQCHLLRLSRLDEPLR